MFDLPSLNGLRAFEAVARKGSIREAASELFVTPGAVSQQVKVLEEALGASLFRRHKRGLILTEQGAALYPVLTEAFQSMALAINRLRENEREGPLTVSVLSSFASKWLVPRLGRFRGIHPEIDVRISATNLLTDFGRDDVDMSIRLGQGEYPGLRSDFLLAEPLYPVCSPRLLERDPPLRHPEDLRHFTLLHDENPMEWQMWLKAHGVEGIDATRGPVFNDASMVLQLAIDGQGVAMTRGELAEDDLEQGRLVKPFDLTIPYRFAYWVVCPEASADRPKIVAFREWILAEAHRGRHTVEAGS